MQVFVMSYAPMSIMLAIICSLTLAYGGQCSGFYLVQNYSNPDYMPAVNSISHNPTYVWRFSPHHYEAKHPLVSNDRRSSISDAMIIFRPNLNRTKRSPQARTRSQAARERSRASVPVIGHQERMSTSMSVTPSQGSQMSLSCKHYSTAKSNSTNNCLPANVKTFTNETYESRSMNVTLNVFPLNLSAQIRLRLVFCCDEKDMHQASNFNTDFSQLDIIKTELWYELIIQVLNITSTNTRARKTWEISFSSGNVTFKIKSNYSLGKSFKQWNISMSGCDVLWYIGPPAICDHYPSSANVNDETAERHQTTETERGKTKDETHEAKYADAPGDDQTNLAVPADAEQPASPGASGPQLLWLLLLAVPVVACIAVIIARMKRREKETEAKMSKGIRNENISPINDDIRGQTHRTQITRQMSVNSLYGQIAPDQIPNRLIFNSHSGGNSQTQITRQMSVNSLYGQEVHHQIANRSTINSLFGPDAPRYVRFDHQKNSRQNLASNITAPNKCINSGRSGPEDEAHNELYLRTNGPVNSNIYENDGEM
ncbi:uncharacterized protein LOC108667716 [Hyalella azteca]|uniref:Uncharacterized protein LOC108667716 n=1 Tax=Hyalella azteca TaxID=294128 RepID=A0A8B7N9S1_HYAAZ|nr:uncharacterized protein LOC108667716 [Hyalella azteca]